MAERRGSRKYNDDQALMGNVALERYNDDISNMNKTNNNALLVVDTLAVSFSENHVHTNYGPNLKIGSKGESDQCIFYYKGNGLTCFVNEDINNAVREPRIYEDNIILGLAHYQGEGEMDDYLSHPLGFGPNKAQTEGITPFDKIHGSVVIPEMSLARLRDKADTQAEPEAVGENAGTDLRADDGKNEENEAEAAKTRNLGLKVGLIVEDQNEVIETIQKKRFEVDEQEPAAAPKQGRGRPKK